MIDVDRYIIVMIDASLTGNAREQALVVDTQPAAGLPKVVAVATSASTAAPIRDALNGV